MNKLPADIAFALRKFATAMSCLPLTDNMLRFHSKMADKIARQIEFDVCYTAQPDARTGFKGEILEVTTFREDGEYKLVVHDKPITTKKE